MMGDHNTSGAWLLMSLMMLVILVLIAWGLFLIWRASVAEKALREPPTDRATAETILRERLARGEIDTEEYRQLLKALRVGAPPAPR